MGFRGVTDISVDMSNILTDISVNFFWDNSGRVVIVLCSYRSWYEWNSGFPLYKSLN